MQRSRAMLTASSTKGKQMADETKRDAKLIQYLTEAFGKEKELETALPRTSAQDQPGSPGTSK